jgi:hypothetical protein
MVNCNMLMAVIELKYGIAFIVGKTYQFVLFLKFIEDTFSKEKRGFSEIHLNSNLRVFLHWEYKKINVIIIIIIIGSMKIIIIATNKLDY